MFDYIPGALQHQFTCYQLHGAIHDISHVSAKSQTSKQHWADKVSEQLIDSRKSLQRLDSIVRRVKRMDSGRWSGELLGVDGACRELRENTEKYIVAETLQGASGLALSIRICRKHGWIVDG